MTVKLLTEPHLSFLNLKVGCTGSSESTFVKCHIVGNHMSRLIIMTLRLSRADPENAVRVERGGVFLVINVCQREPYGPPSYAVYKGHNSKLSLFLYLTFSQI